jgi:CBS domain-containing protein
MSSMASMASIRDSMTPAPQCLDSLATVEEAAQIMATNDIGDVIICEADQLSGIVTDRDITVRAIAQGMDPVSTPVAAICSRNVVTLSPDDPIEDAVKLMRERALRRIPVVEGGRPVGIVSIGDLAIDLDRQSALADISAAPANA